MPRSGMWEIQEPQVLGGVWGKAPTSPSTYSLFVLLALRRGNAFAAGLVRTDVEVALLRARKRHVAAALRALLLHRHLPRNEIALRIALAAVELASLARWSSAKACRRISGTARQSQSESLSCCGIPGSSDRPENARNAPVCRPSSRRTCRTAHPKPRP